jgi:hypothetical protein
MKYGSMRTYGSSGSPDSTAIAVGERTSSSTISRLLRMSPAALRPSPSGMGSPSRQAVR